uniref:glycine--tRNA ligase n=1 Tax=Chromera velia CCMP2878 TaxID=1169474 RepID=A0A0G4HQA8_9ALVE|eukprot:Cvel_30153.t1-p1 / transcript=Cvel_30153.t1 / gene=Cvel_30153 / organism=Chromera_velia_CCMP2878 / gene_product=Glycine--tRNA ligase, putative / transcript_product=Glycine--tRNA ligase, putative / location=Cvel_scaffold4259:1828-6214(-) / protein_length=704 / sequence_SO=supercontig / SO=protein_coding / is_pseudo=false
MSSIRPEAAGELEETAASLRADVEDSKPPYLRKRWKKELENVLKGKFFVAPAFEIYGGVAGLFDLGPPGCAMKAQLEAYWRRHFILHEGMLELGGTCLTPERVLEASGHVERFSDLMVKDETNGRCFRADKLLEEALEARLKESTDEEEKKSLRRVAIQADAMTAQEIHDQITHLDIRAPSSGAALSFPVPFNLMFKTSIGPQGNAVGYLRPETAQGIFVNFRRLLEYNNGKIPFAVAQIGLGFRNEIAPRQGLLRVREFQMAEIEHFVDPIDKFHPRFTEVKDLCLPLSPRETQMEEGCECGARLVARRSRQEKGGLRWCVIDNETLAYFLARTFLFLTGAGIRPEGLRFRQHLEREMAHYATDCWDAEIETSFGWVECVGHADRSAYDLSAHTRASNTELVAHRRLEKPRIVDFVKVSVDKKKIGPAFKQEAEKVLKGLEDMSDNDKLDAEKTLASTGLFNLKLSTGETYAIKREFVSFESAERKVTEESFVPSVIEPSFGLGRILYAIWEHTFNIDSFRARADGKRTDSDENERRYFSFPPHLAPFKVAIVLISHQEEFRHFVTEVHSALSALGLSTLVDSSSAYIGRRYARFDAIGVPFAVTIDLETKRDLRVTLRERDSSEQVRLPMADVPSVVARLCSRSLSWEAVLKKYPKFRTRQPVGRRIREALGLVLDHRSSVCAMTAAVAFMAVVTLRLARRL